MEADKVIETTINKDTKTPGGTTGFSTNSNAINRWALNASHRTKLRCCFHRHLGYVNAKHKHHVLTLSRIKIDEKDVQSLMEVMTNTFIDPLSDNDWLCISHWLAAIYSIYCPRFATSKAAWRRGVDSIYLRLFKRRITGINLWTVSQHQMRYAFMILFSLIFFALLIFFSWILQIVS